MDTEPPRLVARSGHDAALFRTAHRDWLAPELGVVSLLDGGEERVHIDVNDLPLTVGRGLGCDLRFPGGYFLVHARYPAWSAWSRPALLQDDYRAMASTMCSRLQK